MQTQRMTTEGERSRRWPEEDDLGSALLARDRRSSRRATAGVRRRASGLGWLSIGLGAGEVFAPAAVATLIGARDQSRTRRLLRAFGARELACGIGILTGRRTAGWLWARVAGDTLDLAYLARLLGA